MSKGEGERLSSTLNLPEASPITRCMDLIMSNVSLPLKLISWVLLMIILRITGVHDWNLESGPDPEGVLIPLI